MNKNVAWTIAGSIAVATITGTLILASRNTTLKKKIQAWKKQRIANSYYDTITEKDIAWG